MYFTATHRHVDAPYFILLLAFLMSIQLCTAEKDTFCDNRADDKLYADPDDCQVYVYCSSGYPYRSRCEGGLYYDGEQQACVYEMSSCLRLRKLIGYIKSKASTEPPTSTAAATTTSHVTTPTTTTTTTSAASDSNNQDAYNEISAVDLKSKLEEVVLNQTSVPKRRIIRKIPGLDTFCTSRPDGSYPDPSDCRLYIVCSNGFAYQGTCPKRLVYVPDKRKCYFGTANTCRKHRERLGNEGDLSAAKAVAEKAATLNELATEKAAIYGHRNAMRRRISQLMPIAILHAMSSLTKQLNEESIQAIRFSDSSHHRMSADFSPIYPISRQLSMPAYVVTNASSLVIQQLGLPVDEGVALLQALGSPLPIMSRRIAADDPYPRPSPGICPWPRYTCPPSPYRSHDGSCNNLPHPLWGRAFTPYARALQPSYDDEMSAFRRSVEGGSLPSPRLLSTTLHPPGGPRSQLYTSLVSHWGQFISHDLSQVAVSTLSEDPRGYGEIVPMTCGSDGCSTQNPSCAPITLRTDDPLGPKANCIPYVRSQPATGLGCEVGGSEQLNQVTSYLDASMLYGSSVDTSREIREMADPDRGKLRFSDNPSGASFKEYLPTVASTDCPQGQPRCILSGDGRANLHAGITSLHTLLLRHHNRIETILHGLNPAWSGERLYNEVRKITTATLQHLTYNEYIPAILGATLTNTYDIDLLQHGFYTGYDSSVDASITSSFLSAASGFIFSTLANSIPFKNRTVNIAETIFNPTLLQNITLGGVDSVVEGLTKSRMHVVDRYVESGILGDDMDPIAMAIHQARDHGIPVYNSWRGWCGISEAQDFDDLTEIDEHLREKLEKVYRSVEDIDLLVGGLLESPASGAMVGPTFSCIIGNQMKNLRKGDRYWYENAPPQGFTADQLQEIRKQTLAGFICDNTDDVITIQPEVLLLPIREAYPAQVPPPGISQEWFHRLWESNYNGRISCAWLPKMDYLKWKDNK